MQFYACVCISTTLVQYNPMFVHVYPLCLCNACTTTKPKCAPWGDDCGLSGGRFAQQATIASFGGLAAYIALTAALVCYAKDKRAFITTRQRVEQTIKDLRHRVCT